MNEIFLGGMGTNRFGKENTLGIEFLFDGVQAGIVGSPECLLAVRLIDVGLIDELVSHYGGRGDQKARVIPLPDNNQLPEKCLSTSSYDCW